jgi:plastocyanin
MKPGKNLVLGSLLFIIAFAASAALLYGGAKLVEREDTVAEAVDDGTAGGVPGGPSTIRLVAKDLKFDKRSVSASPGGDVTLTLDNQDAGVPHNVGFYSNNRATQSYFVGQLITGPTSATATFKAPAAPGNYYFRCDAHPDTMNGTFSVR